VTASVVLVDVADRVGLVTLNRPEARNAIGGGLLPALVDALTSLEADDDVDVIVLTGTDPAFCAGMDLKELGQSRPDAGPSANPLARLAQRGPFPARSKLLIGAVNGPAITGGLELALNCDFLVASERARFADTHARVAVMPGWGITVLLVERIGVTRAREMSATGNFVDAGTALAWGLVNHVVPHDELVPFALRLAADCVSNDQRGVRRMLRTYAEIAHSIYEDAWAIELGVSVAWEGAGFDGDVIEARRQGIIDRGRSQLHD
jgi:enoyl-CoA hydratase